MFGTAGLFLSGRVIQEEICAGTVFIEKFELPLYYGTIILYFLCPF
jgi:hypothetical protein